MQVISLIYGYSEISPSVPVLLYFRMIGVYIIEKFLNQKVNLDKEFDLLAEKEDIKDAEDDFCDAEIYLLKSQAEYEEYSRLKSRYPEIVCCDEKGGVRTGDKDILYNEKNYEKLLQDILDSLYNRDILKPEEYSDCCKALHIYCNADVMQLTLSTKYFYLFDEEERYKEKIDQYKNVIWSLSQELENVNPGKLGDDFYVHLQYALIRYSYEADLYCRRNNKPFIYNVPSLLSISNKLLDHSTSLEMGVKTLIGLVYSNLLSNENEAYNSYLQACYGRGFNAYLYMLKGQYWQNFDVDYKKANRYFLFSVRNFPEYYRVWYKIGCCLIKMKKPEKALIAFDTVRKILLQRLDAGCIKVMEIEHFFLACHQYADIVFKEYKDAKTAIQYYLYAEKAWDSVMDTRIFELISKEKSEIEQLRKIARKNLDIENVYNRLIMLYARAGQMKEAALYNDKLNRL